MIIFDVEMYNNNKLLNKVIVNTRVFNDLTLGRKLEQYL